MEETIAKLSNAIKELLDIYIHVIDWEYKPAPEKWSKKEIIGHLIDSAQINLQRFVRCTYEENFKLVYEQVKWVKALYYQDADIHELLMLWKLLNYQIIRVWENYPAGRLIICCDSGKDNISLHTVAWLAEDYVSHMKHHLQQVKSMA